MSKRVAGIQLTADNTDEIEGEREEVRVFSYRGCASFRLKVFRVHVGWKFPGC